MICAYLDDLTGGGRVIPDEREPRFAVLTLEALADGIADAAILQIYEKRMRAESQTSENWIAHQRGKIDRAMAALEAAPPAPGVTHIGAIALACALGYLDLRFDGSWRAGHPRLVAWLDSFAAAVPAFDRTRA